MIFSRINSTHCNKTSNLVFRLKIFIVFLFLMVSFFQHKAAHAASSRICPPTAEGTLPLLRQNHHDYPDIARKVAMLNNDKHKVLMLISDYTYEVFTKYNYSLADTIDSCIKSQSDERFNYNYIKSGLQKLIEPVLIAALDPALMSEIVNKGYVHKQTIDYMLHPQSAEASPSEKMQSRFGDIVIDGEKILNINGKQSDPLIQGNNDLLIKDKTEFVDHDVFIVEDVGGTACPATFYLLDISKGNYRIFGPLGTCNDKISITKASQAIVIKIPGHRDSKNEKIYIYKNHTIHEQ